MINIRTAQGLANMRAIAEQVARWRSACAGP